jgi:hypothetical protein
VTSPAPAPPLSTPWWSAATRWDRLVLLLVLVLGWLWIWGACWNPWRVSCFLQPTGHGDPVQHYLGWHVYAFSTPVRLIPPLFDQWTWPHPLPLLYADVIPLAAVVLRPLQRLVGQPFQYFSVLSLLNILATGLLGHRIGWEATGSRGAAFALGLALGLAPPMVMRTFAHEALSLQVLIVLALALLIRRESRFWPWALLLALAPGVHGYFMALLFPLVAVRLLSSEFAPSALADGWRGWCLRRWGWSPPARVLDALSLGLVLAVMVWLVGYTSGDVERSPDWGENWSANLLAFLDSNNSSPIVPPLGRHMPYQIEGFAYLGLFVILAAPLVRLFWGRRRPRAATLFPSPALFWGLLALRVVFAWGPRWYAGPQALLDLGVLKRLPLTSTAFLSFRATGRFLWPAYYALTIWTIVHLWTLFRAAWWPKLVFVVFLLSLWESHSIPLQAAHHHFQHRQAALPAGTDPVPAALVDVARRPGSLLINVTDNPRAAPRTLPSFALQRLAPGVTTNHAPYLARYPRVSQAAAGATSCERMGNVLREHPEIRERVWFVVEGEDSERCRPLPGWTVERLLDLSPRKWVARPIPQSGAGGRP